MTRLNKQDLRWNNPWVFSEVGLQYMGGSVLFELEGFDEDIPVSFRHVLPAEIEVNTL
jgi:hypothetical protein